MTVSTQTFRWSYTATAAASTLYPYDNKILDEGDLTVYVDDVLQAISTDYEVSGVGLDAGGNVTFVAAPAEGAGILITKDGIEFTQGTDYVENDSFPAEAHEDALDKLTNLCQRIWDYTRRSVKLSVTSTQTDLELENIVANKAIVVNTGGDALVMGPSTEEISKAQTYAEGADDAKTASENARDLSEAAAASTDADVIATAADRVQTGEDRVQTGLDVIATNDDVLLLHADVILTHADVVLTHADVVLTHEDEALTNADAIATEADREQTGLDVGSTGADAVQTALDVIATAADRVQTGLDVIQTAADRVQTGLDVTSAGSAKDDAVTAETNAETAETNTAALKADTQGIYNNIATYLIKGPNAELETVSNGSDWGGLDISAVFSLERIPDDRYDLVQGSNSFDFGTIA